MWTLYLEKAGGVKSQFDGDAVTFRIKLREFFIAILRSQGWVGDPGCNAAGVATTAVAPG